MHPSLPWLKQALAGPEPPKMVVLCNPCNPTGEPSLYLHRPGSGCTRWHRPHQRLLRALFAVRVGL